MREREIERRVIRERERGSMREKAYQSFWERLRGVGLSMGGERKSNSNKRLKLNYNT